MGIATLADIELVGGGLLPAPSRLVLLQLLQLYLAGPRGLGVIRLPPYDNPYMLAIYLSLRPRHITALAH